MPYEWAFEHRRDPSKATGYFKDNLKTGLYIQRIVQNYYEEGDADTPPLTKDILKELLKKRVDLEGEIGEKGPGFGLEKISTIGQTQGIRDIIGTYAPLSKAENAFELYARDIFGGYATEDDLTKAQQEDVYRKNAEGVSYIDELETKYNEKYNSENEYLEDADYEVIGFVPISDTQWGRGGERIISSLVTAEQSSVKEGGFEERVITPEKWAKGQFGYVLRNNTTGKIVVESRGNTVDLGDLDQSLFEDVAGTGESLWKYKGETYTFKELEKIAEKEGTTTMQMDIDGKVELVKGSKSSGGNVPASEFTIGIEDELALNKANIGPFKGFTTEDFREEVDGKKTWNWKKGFNNLTKDNLDLGSIFSAKDEDAKADIINNSKLKGFGFYYDPSNGYLYSNVMFRGPGDIAPLSTNEFGGGREYWDADGNEKLAKSVYVGDNPTEVKNFIMNNKRDFDESYVVEEGEEVQGFMVNPNTPGYGTYFSLENWVDVDVDGDGIIDKPTVTNTNLLTKPILESIENNAKEKYKIAVHNQEVLYTKENNLIKEIEAKNQDINVFRDLSDGIRNNKKNGYRGLLEKYGKDYTELLSALEASEADLDLSSRSEVRKHNKIVKKLNNLVGEGTDKILLEEYNAPFNIDEWDQKGFEKSEERPYYDPATGKPTKDEWLFKDRVHHENWTRDEHGELIKTPYREMRASDVYFSQFGKGARFHTLTSKKTGATIKVSSIDLENLQNGMSLQELQTKYDNKFKENAAGMLEAADQVEMLEVIRLDRAINIQDMYVDALFMRENADKVIDRWNQVSEENEGLIIEGNALDYLKWGGNVGVDYFQKFVQGIYSMPLRAYQWMGDVTGLANEYELKHMDWTIKHFQDGIEDGFSVLRTNPNSHWEKEFNESVAGMVTRTMIEMALDIATIRIGGVGRSAYQVSNVAKFLKNPLTKRGIGAGLKAGANINLPMFTRQFMDTERLMQDPRFNNMSPAEKFSYNIAQSYIIGKLDKIGIDLNMTGARKIVDDLVAYTFKNGNKKGAAKWVNKRLAQMIEVGVLRPGLGAPGEIIVENLQNVVQLGMEDIANNVWEMDGRDDMMGTGFVNVDWFSPEFWEEVKTTTLVAGIAAGGMGSMHSTINIMRDGGGEAISDLSAKQINFIRNQYDDKTVEVFEKDIAERVNNKEMSEDLGNKLIKENRDFYEVVKLVPAEAKPKVQKEVLQNLLKLKDLNSQIEKNGGKENLLNEALLVEKKKTEDKLKALSYKALEKGEFTLDQDGELVVKEDQIREEHKEFTEKTKKTLKAIEEAGGLLTSEATQEYTNELQKRIGDGEITVQQAEEALIDFQTRKLDIKIAKNSKQADELAADIGQSMFDDNGNRVHAIYTPEGEIIVDTEAAIRLDGENVLEHETFHWVLRKTIDNAIAEGNEDLVFGLANSALKEIQKIDPDNIQDSELVDRLQMYEDDATISDIETAEEVITLLSDAMNSKDIKIPIKPLKQIKQKITNLFKVKGIDVEITDPIAFIKDYNKSVKKGKFTESQVKGIEEGFKVSEDITATQTELETTKKEVGVKIKKDKDKKEVKKKKKESKAKSNLKGLSEQYDMSKPSGRSKFISETLTKKPDGTETFNFTESTLGQEVGPIIEATTKRLYDKVPDDLKRDISRQEFKNDLISLTGTLIQNEYDPTKQDLDAFVSNRMNLRANKLATNTFGQEFTEDVSEARKLSSEPVTEITIDEKTPTKEIKLKERLGPDAVKISEEVIKKGKDVDLTKVDFKSLKDLTPDLTQEMFGVKPKKGNLTKQDVKNAQQFITKNAETLIAMLPEGSTPSGTSTGVQKVLLKPFYRQGERVTTKKTGSKAGLKEQTKRDNITKEEFLEVFGITEAGTPNKIDRNTSAKVKALIDQTGRMLTNQAIREQAVKKGEKVPSKVHEGKSRKMYSKPAQKFGKAGRQKHGDFSRQMKQKGLVKKDNQWVLDEEGIKYRNRVYNEIQHLFHPDFFLTNNFGFSSRSLFGAEEGLTGGQAMAQALEGKKGNNKKTAPPKRFQYKHLSADQIKAKIKDPAWRKNEEKKLPYLKEIFKTIEADLKKNPDHLPFWEAFINDAQNNQGHVIRYLAPFKFYSNVDGKTTEEHSLPQKMVGNYLLQSAIDGTVDQDFKLIKDNYFQGALLDQDDGKLRIPKKVSKDGFNFISDMPEVFLESESPQTWMRYLNDLVSGNQGGINPNNYTLITGETIAQKYGAEVAPEFQQDPDVIALQQATIMIKLENPKFDPQGPLKAYTDSIAKQKNKARKKILKEIDGSKVKSGKRYSKSPSNEAIRELGILDKALEIARDPNAPVKKIRVFDFDDTLAQTKSHVLYTMPNGNKGKLTAEEFAKRGTELQDNGAVFDFSEFNKVMDGKKGPLFEVAQKIQEVRGTEDVFVLTARAPEAAFAIKEFLDSLGLNIPLENITGLGDSSPLAKSGWIVDKAAEGYNDFYFADDHKANVEAVQKAIDKLPVKGKTQQAKVKFSMNTKQDLNWRKDGNDFKTSFDLKGNTYNIRLQEDPSGRKGVYELDFGLEGDKKGMLGKVGITKTGNAAEVFSIVSNGVLDLARNNNVNEIQFSAIEPSRSRLYETLTKFWANKLGWGHEADVMLDGSGYFTIGKDVQDASSFENQSKPTQKVLGVIDKKSKTQRAKAKFSKPAGKIFNTIIEQKTGVEAHKVFSDAKAKVRGRKKGRGQFFIPPSAEDFEGLLYKTLAKGKLGNDQKAWYKEVLFDPFARAMNDMAADERNMIADFKAIKQVLKEGGIPKNLNKKAVDSYTYSDVARILAWDKQGIKIDGLNKTDLANIKKFAAKNPAIDVFAQQLVDINKGSGYKYPGSDWLVGTITTDLMDGLNTTKRSEYLKEWQENVDNMFTKENLNKLEAIWGSKYREAIENSLYRMKTGRNRTGPGSRIENQLLEYLNNSVGAVMFFNMRSAALQTLSTINFANWSFNNPAKMAKAFANQPQYWKDFMELMNSDFLVTRRKGLRINVSESEIADAAATGTNKAKGAINYILRKGFLPTQFADSFAIASGGATFYRNRINDLMKNEKMSEEDAKAKAYEEFREISEASQQSSRPDKISQQQASGIGRVILAFANTPSQYARIIKKATSDLVNGRGDWRHNMSKILYYGFAQNIIFNALQQAIFAWGWDEDDDDEEKYGKVANGMLDSILRGLGWGGALVSALKNVGIDAYGRLTDPDPGFRGMELWKSGLKFLDFAPPVDVKISKLMRAGSNWEFNAWRPEASNPFDIDNPAYKSIALVIAATTNIPVDRLFQKQENVRAIFEQDQENWKRVALLFGYPEWQLESTKQREDRKEEEKDQKRNLKAQDNLKLYTKDEQIDILKQHGLDDEQISDLKNETERVEAIKYLNDKFKVNPTPSKAVKQEIKEKKKEKEKEKEKEKQKEIDAKDKVKEVVEKKEESKTFSAKTSFDKSKTRKKILAADRTPQQVRLYNLNKANQIDTLKSLGLSNSQVEKLRYEEDRVRKIEELYENR